ncbi:hypothetical protein HGM15179_018650 [Zosterops borbonicus]|uniref:Uncharacterized protein n=1 Tax=Zosterops borbonicus TaxID=364589 RepID=A0A8K1DB08_9PASS|nr:hypothetical protein HGM15179_018650 [Zosterops borbonicus]
MSGGRTYGQDLKINNAQGVKKLVISIFRFFFGISPVKFLGVPVETVDTTKTLANLDKNHFLANARKKFLRDNNTNLINLLAIPSALRRNKQNEISIRLTHEIDIRKSFSRNETMRPDEIREGHRKEIRTIQPILDTWTA